MNDDIRGTLSRALPDDLPAPRIDMDTVEQKGERLARRRRAGLAGLASVGIAVFAAAVAIPLVVMGPGDDGLAGNGRDGYSLPELDPDTDYDWDFGHSEERNDETRDLSRGFWDYLSKRFPDIGVPDLSEGWPSEGNMEFLEPQDYPTAMRVEWNLREVKADSTWPESSGSEDFIATDYTKPVYVTDGSFTALTSADDKYIDSFTMAVHPKGSYAEGPKSVSGYPQLTAAPHLAAGCENGSYGKYVAYAFECEQTTGPDGEKIYQIERTDTGGERDPEAVVSRMNTVIVTLSNGNAVVLSDEASIEGDRPTAAERADQDNIRPALSCDELTELALELPEVLVE